MEPTSYGVEYLQKSPLASAWLPSESSHMDQIGHGNSLTQLTSGLNESFSATFWETWHKQEMLIVTADACVIIHTPGCKLRCMYKSTNYRFNPINLSRYRLASIPNPSTNRAGPVSNSALLLPPEPCPPPAADEAIGAPPRSRKKLTAADPVDRPRECILPGLLLFGAVVEEDA